MANTKITALDEIGATPAATDVIPIVDVSDTTMAASGTTKKVLASRFLMTTGGSVTGSLAVSGSVTTTNVSASGNVNANASIGSAWQNVSYTTGWEDLGSGHWGCQYKKFGDIVYIRGACKRTSGSSFVLFNLPVGYRPPGISNVAIFSNGAGGMISVATNGNVTLDVGGTANVFLTGAWFSTAS